MTSPLVSEAAEVTQVAQAIAPAALIVTGAVPLRPDEPTPLIGNCPVTSVERLTALHVHCEIADDSAPMCGMHALPGPALGNCSPHDVNDAELGAMSANEFAFSAGTVVLPTTCAEPACVPSPGTATFTNDAPAVSVQVSTFAVVMPSSQRELTMAFAPLDFGKYPVVSDVDVVLPLALSCVWMLEVGSTNTIVAGVTPSSVLFVSVCVSVVPTIVPDGAVSDVPHALPVDTAIPAPG